MRAPRVGRRSHGKARPALPRAANLKPADVVQRTDEPGRSRDNAGRFGKGNALARGRGWKRALVRMLGRDASDLPEVASTIAADAWRLFVASMREMPHDGANVRALVARKARHEALEAYYGARALEKLGTPEGDAADEQATKHGARAERLTVTALDVARVLAEQQRHAARPAFDLGAHLDSNGNGRPDEIVSDVTRVTSGACAESAYAARTRRAPSEPPPTHVGASAHPGPAQRPGAVAPGTVVRREPPQAVQDAGRVALFVDVPRLAVLPSLTPDAVKRAADASPLVLSTDALGRPCVVARENAGPPRRPRVTPEVIAKLRERGVPEGELHRMQGGEEKEQER